MAKSAFLIQAVCLSGGRGAGVISRLLTAWRVCAGIWPLLPLVSSLVPWGMFWAVCPLSRLSICSGLRAFGLFQFWVTVSRVLWVFPCLRRHELSFHLFFLHPCAGQGEEEPVRPAADAPARPGCWLAGFSQRLAFMSQLVFHPQGAGREVYRKCQS